jgi:hypothetical protein
VITDPEEQDVPTDYCLPCPYEPVPKEESITEASVEGVQGGSIRGGVPEEQLVSYSRTPAQVPRRSLMIRICRELRLRVLQVLIAVVLMVKVSPTTHRDIASAPSKDDCYGNSIDPRFCLSEMPSSTEEPTDVPNQQPVLPPLAQVMIDLKTACAYAIPPRVASPRCPTQRRRNIGVSPIGAAATLAFPWSKTGGQFALSSQVTGERPWGVMVLRTN